MVRLTLPLGASARLVGKTVDRRDQPRVQPLVQAFGKNDADIRVELIYERGALSIRQSFHGLRAAVSLSFFLRDADIEK